MNLTGICK